MQITDDIPASWWTIPSWCLHQNGLEVFKGASQSQQVIKCWVTLPRKRTIFLFWKYNFQLTNNLLSKKWVKPLGVCHSECSFPHLHGAVRSWGQHTEACHVPNMADVYCSHSNLTPWMLVTKCCWDYNPAWQEDVSHAAALAARSTFHLWPANQEVGAEAQWASETWDYDSRKNQRDGEELNRGFQSKGSLETLGNPCGHFLFCVCFLSRSRAYFFQGLQMGFPLPQAQKETQVSPSLFDILERPF